MKTTELARSDKKYNKVNGLILEGIRNVTLKKDIDKRNYSNNVQTPDHLLQDFKPHANGKISSNFHMEEEISINIENSKEIEKGKQNKKEKNF